jgi:acetyl-CoA carboxylase carboxyltransferase component
MTMTPDPPLDRPAEDAQRRSPSTKERVQDLRARRAEVRCVDDASSVRQRDRGKLTVRERLDLLLDPGSFQELELFRRHRSESPDMAGRHPSTDGVVVGYGKVLGRPAFVYGQDFRLFGGSLGEAHAQKIHKVMDMAIQAGAPLISLNDGAGARIQEGVTALAGYGGIFVRNTEASGRIPQLSLMLGPCAGGAAYSPALTDFVFMVENTSQMFVTGPDVVRTVTGEQIDIEGLGGAQVHTSTSGVAHCSYVSEADCIEDARYLLSFLPQNSDEAPPVYACEDPLDRSNDALIDKIPSSGRVAYDVRDVIEEIVDDGLYLELRAGWAQSLVTCFVRIGGRTVGVVANQSMHRAGVLDAETSQKGAAFVQFCDSFNIPLLTLVDVPGFMPGVDQEHGGIIRHGAKLLSAYCQATVPRVSVILRKAYGGAFIVMDSRSIGADLCFAWPGNEIAVMGAEAAARVVYRREIADSHDPVAEEIARATAFREELMHPYYAAERGLVDEVIDPVETRATVAAAFEMLRGKTAYRRRKHVNQPQ